MDHPVVWPIREIENVVRDHVCPEVSRAQLRARGRDPTHSLARQCVWLLVREQLRGENVARDYANSTYPALGRLYSRHPSTIWLGEHMLRKILRRDDLESEPIRLMFARIKRDLTICTRCAYRACPGGTICEERTRQRLDNLRADERRRRLRQLPIRQVRA